MNATLTLDGPTTPELQEPKLVIPDTSLYEQGFQRESNAQYYLQPNDKEQEVATRLVERAKTDPVVLQLREPSLNAGDRETLLHSDGVALAAVVIGQRLGCSEEELESIATAGLVHDIGKAADPAIQALVLSPRKFTDKEHRKLELHPLLSAEKILETTGWPNEKLQAVHDISLAHHAFKHVRAYGERPSGNQVPAMAMALADIFDSLSSARGYRPYALTCAEAREIIHQEFDADPEFIQKALGEGPPPRSRSNHFAHDVGERAIELTVA